MKSILHYLMNKDTPVLEIETGNILNYRLLPISLMFYDDKPIENNIINKWIKDRALPLNRINADKIYEAIGLQTLNNEIELMYMTHGLSINDNFWIVSENEINKLKYENYSLFRNRLDKEISMTALFGNKATIIEDVLSAEYTGQGSYPKCFLQDIDGVYMIKSGTKQEIDNEITAGIIAKILGLKSTKYRRINYLGLECTLSKIETSEEINWETALSLMCMMQFRDLTPQKFALNNYAKEFSNIIIFDGIVLNDDRHMQNWAFEIDASTNQILSLAHSYDYNNAFKDTNNTISLLIKDKDKSINILKAAQKAYLELGTTLKIERLYNEIDYLDFDINKDALRNRIEYITGNKKNQQSCY